MRRKEREMIDEKNEEVTVDKSYLKILEKKAMDSEYYRGRVDGMEYVIDSIQIAIGSEREG